MKTERCEALIERDKKVISPCSHLSYFPLAVKEAKGSIITDEDGLTACEGIYAGGDAVTGAATVILAMGAGKKAAAAMDLYIQNKQKME